MNSVFTALLSEYGYVAFIDCILTTLDKKAMEYLRSQLKELDKDVN